MMIGCQLVVCARLFAEADASVSFRQKFLDRGVPFGEVFAAQVVYGALLARDMVCT